MVEEASKEDDVEALNNLRSLAASRGQRDLVESFPDTFLQSLLRHKKNQEAVLRALNGVEVGLERLRQLEQQVDVNLLHRYFLEGKMFSRGTSKSGLPVLHQVVDGYQHWKERLVQFFWVLLLVLRQRKDCDRGYIYIGYFGDGRTWASNLKFSIEATRILSLILPHPPRDIQANIVVMSPFLHYFLSWVIGHLPETFKGLVCVPSSDKEVLSIVDDPNYFPSGAIAGHGQPFQPSYETVGDFYRVLERRGFAKLTIKDIFRPDLVPIVYNMPFDARAKSFQELEDDTGDLVPRKPISILRGLHFDNRATAKERTPLEIIHIRTASGAMSRPEPKIQLAAVFEESGESREDE